MSVTTIGTWEGTAVTVGEVDAALTAMRRGDRRAGVRTSVLTLVVVVAGDAGAEAALSTIADLGNRHPSRTVVLVVEPDPDAGAEPATPADDSDPRAPLDGFASVHIIDRGGSSASFERVVLRVRGRARHHLDSVVAPFTLPDVPVVVWLPSVLPAPGDPLLAVADRIVIDSRAVAEEGSADRSQVLPRIAALGRRLPVTDLSWARLASWRSLLAGMFDSPVYRPFLDGVEAVEVAGNFGPRHLLAGWLSSRLGLDLDRFTLNPAEHVSLRLTATAGGQQGTFGVERPGAERTVRAWARIDDGPCMTQTLTMRRQWPALALADALSTMGRDQSYRRSLEGALALLGSGGAR